MMADRFIKLYDKILKWEWYKNTNVKVLFLHLLLKANFKDMSFEGHKILRGQLVTSLPSLSSELGMTTRQIRVSLDHLIMTGEVATKSYPRYRVITIIHYDEYQSDGRQNGSQMTGRTAAKRQSNDSQMTGGRQADDSQMTASIEYIESIEGIEKKEHIEREKTASRFTPPTREEILRFCEEAGLEIDVDRFINYYTANGWMVGKNKMKDWKATVRNWVHRDVMSKQSGPAKSAPAPQRSSSSHNFEERDYSGVQDDEMSRLAEEMRRFKETGELF